MVLKNDDSQLLGLIDHRENNRNMSMKSRNKSSKMRGISRDEPLNSLETLEKHSDDGDDSKLTRSEIRAKRNRQSARKYRERTAAKFESLVKGISDRDHYIESLESILREYEISLPPKTFVDNLSQDCNSRGSSQKLGGKQSEKFAMSAPEKPPITWTFSD